MSWTAPPTFVAGTVFTAANANILAGNLADLTSSFGLYGVGFMLTGSKPSSDNPGNYLPQISSVTGTTSGFNISETFPQPYPAGVAIILVTPTAGTSGTWSWNVATASTTGFTLETSVSASAVAFSYLAIGF